MKTSLGFMLLNFLVVSVLGGRSNFASEITSPYPESKFGSPSQPTLLEIEAHEQDRKDRRQRSEDEWALKSEEGRSESVRSLASARSPVQEIAMIVGDLGFFPKTLLVTRQIPVRLFVTGASKKALCLMQDDFQVRKQIQSQKITEITFTPAKSGQFRFYCPINGMEGVILVKELRD